MSGPNEKGSFSADIAQDVIDAALESVKRRTSDAEPEAEVTLDVESAPPLAAEPAAAEPAEPAEPMASEPVASAELERLTAELEASRKETEALRAQLEFSQAESRKLMERLKEDHERALRTAADLENYKKRAQKEKEEVQKFGSEKLLKDFIPVLDNLDRALDASAKSSDFASFQKGVAMTRKSFEDMLARHGVKGFSAKGLPFDPHLHEAMQQVETTEVPPGHVAFEVLRGYNLNERLVRPALVAVARAPVSPPSEQPGASAAPETEQPSGGSKTPWAR